MDCKKTKANISKFIEDSLEGRELREFIDHIGHCEDCKEELSIQFLVTEGLSRLENSSSFDIQGRLNEKLKRGDRIAKARQSINLFMYGCELLVFIAVIVMAVILILR